MTIDANTTLYGKWEKDPEPEVPEAPETPASHTETAAPRHLATKSALPKTGDAGAVGAVGAALAGLGSLAAALGVRGKRH